MSKKFTFILGFIIIIKVNRQWREIQIFDSFLLKTYKNDESACQYFLLFLLVVFLITVPLYLFFVCLERCKIQIFVSLVFLFLHFFSLMALCQ